MKILYITQFFPPELNGGATRVYDLAKIWADLGHDVTVTTCVPCHPTGVIPEDYQGKQFEEETIDGFRVRWTPVYTTPNEGFGKRILNHISFMFWAVMRNFSLKKKYDAIIATSPPLFVGISGYVLGLFSRCPFVFEVRDLWPKQAIDLGALKNKYVIRVAEALEMFLYRKAHRVICVTPDSKETLVARGINKSKIEVIPNGVDCNAFQEMPPSRDILKAYDLSEKFVVSYIGTHGMSQGLDHILDAASKLQEQDKIHFLFVGDGAEKKRLMEYADTLKLSNVTFADTVLREDVAKLYCASDICLVPLKDTELFKRTIPSKIFEIMAIGTPIFLGVDGEARRILEASGGGLAYKPESGEILAEEIRKAFVEPDGLQHMRGRGRAFVNQNYNRTILAQRYVDEVLAEALR